MNWTFRIPSSFAKQLSWTETLVWPKYWGKNNILRLYSLTHSTKWWLSSSIPKIGGKKTFKNSLKTFVRPLIEAIKIRKYYFTFIFKCTSLSHIILGPGLAIRSSGFRAIRSFFCERKSYLLVKKSKSHRLLFLRAKTYEKTNLLSNSLVFC